MKLARTLIIDMLFSLFLAPTHFARTDAAPPPINIGLQPFEYEKAEVQMVYERVETDPYNRTADEDPSEI